MILKKKRPGTRFKMYIREVSIIIVLPRSGNNTAGPHAFKLSQLTNRKPSLGRRMPKTLRLCNGQESGAFWKDSGLISNVKIVFLFKGAQKQDRLPRAHDAETHPFGLSYTVRVVLCCTSIHSSLLRRYYSTEAVSTGRSQARKQLGSGN